MYAREGFGRFTAFNVARGYWLMTIFSNVAFAIMVMDTLNYFYCVISREGTIFLPLSVPLC